MSKAAPFNVETSAIFETDVQKQLWTIDNYYTPTSIAVAIRIARYKAHLEAQLKARTK